MMLATLIILTFMAFAAPSQQSTSAHVFFLARSDSSGDGLIDLYDENRLYVSTDGNEPTALSTTGASAIQFASRPDGAFVAYSWQEDEQTNIETVDVTDPTVRSLVQMDDLQNIRLALYESGLWVVGTNSDGLPVIRGIDPLSDRRISERTMRRPETQIEFHHSGNWILAYSLEAGALSVLQVPSLQGVPFEVSGYASGRPKWSSIGESLLIGSRSVDNPDDLAVLVVDLTSLSTSRYDLPDYPVGTSVELSWSTHGQYIQVQTDSTPGNVSLPLLAFLRLTDGTLLAATTENVDIVWEWSVEDAAAIVSEGISLNESQQIGLTFELYDPAQNTFQSIPATAEYQTFNLRWNPTETALAMLAQSVQSGLYGLYVFSQGAVQDELTTYFETTNARVSQGRLDWSTDGSRIFFFVPEDNMLFTPLGAIWAGFMLDLETQSVTRISPEDSIVDILQIQIR